MDAYILPWDALKLYARPRKHKHPVPTISSPKLLDQVRHAARLKHYSSRTERSYVQWIRRFILFHGKRHPASMGAEEDEPALRRV